MATAGHWRMLMAVTIPKFDGSVCYLVKNALLLDLLYKMLKHFFIFYKKSKEMADAF